ncbi:hypothetical protein H6F44_01290 [Pseudanabaena sp. FACHB-1277]|uniref:Uncharacterized protein n=1 Tax=Pseudanabaena cinerea FACHB-1277 TaxID=2949581 RepID=A0A926UR47_9CYAN|nr:hypothetical protein [Pseudanabaena cinerea]MBD2148767.1 hypothetical protein [Pseudanabaena cinerea FACHB-1277]
MQWCIAISRNDVENGRSLFLMLTEPCLSRVNNPFMLTLLGELTGEEKLSNLQSV